MRSFNALKNSASLEISFAPSAQASQALKICALASALEVLEICDEKQAPEALESCGEVEEACSPSAPKALALESNDEEFCGLSIS